MSRFCSNPECFSVRATGASGQFPDTAVTCPFCNHPLIDGKTLDPVAPDPVTLGRLLERRLDIAGRLRVRSLGVTLLALLLAGIASRPADSLFDLAPGTTIGVVVFTAMIALLVASIVRVAVPTGVRRERDPLSDADGAPGSDV